MIPHLPPFQTLRAFDAAARHLSYSRAANELGLTHGAISHHIARLEADLGGIRLFIRDGQRMILTDAGQIFVMEVRDGLRTLAQALDRARARPRKNEGRRVLTVSILPSLAARWLVPRLSRFQTAHPCVDVAIRPAASLALLNGHDGIDLAIRYGPGIWPGVQSTSLMKSFIFPVCSQDFLARTPLRSADDFSKVTLLRNPRQKWRPWFLAAGFDLPEPAQGPIYDDAGLLLQAAVEGQGVALARSVLAADDLAAGRLVRVNQVAVEDDYGWYVVWHEPLLCDPNDFGQFQQWLEKEASAENLRSS